MTNSGWSNDSFKTLTVGTVPGEHFVFNNAATGDILDVYDSFNNLVFSIDQFGQLFSYETGANTDLEIHGGLLIFNNQAGNHPLSTGANIAFAGGSATAARLSISAGLPAGALTQAQLQLNANTTVNATSIVGQQFNLSGNVVQLDQTGNLGTGNMRHVFSGSGTTDGSGKLVIATGASFAAIGASVHYNQTGRGGGPWCSGIWTDVPQGDIGTQWMTTAGALANTTVYYVGEIWG